MAPSIMSADAVRRALSIRDLTDPSQGSHAIQHLTVAAVRCLEETWQIPSRVRRGSPIVSIADNYDRLRYPEDGVARDGRYTRYVCDVAVLRTQTSAMVPPLLREVADRGDPDVLLACPGIVYRRDAIDRLHTGEPHQLDLWRVRRGTLDESDLTAMIAAVVSAVLPERAWRVLPATHPYTERGLQIDVRDGDAWIEIGECGLAHPAVLRDAGLDAHAGLAMGLGLDRMLMLRKNVDDIRLLRAGDPRISDQMRDLAPYRVMSAMPAIRRDLSIVVRADADAEDLGDRVRAALGDRADAVEAVSVAAETAYADLPHAARLRLGLDPGQKNVLVRVVLRDLARTLTHAEANALRDAIYVAIHEGPYLELAG